MYNHGNEFLGHVFKNNIFENIYGNKSKCATTANPQANLIKERIRQVIENLVRMLDLKKYLSRQE